MHDVFECLRLSDARRFSVLRFFGPFDLVERVELFGWRVREILGDGKTVGKVGRTYELALQAKQDETSRKDSVRTDRVQINGEDCDSGRQTAER